MMEHKNNKEKTPLILAILWMISTIMWIVIVCINISDGNSPFFLTALQCAAAIAFGAAAAANFIRYKRGRDDKSEG